MQALPTEILHPILTYAFHNHHRPTWSVLVWLSSTSTVKQVSSTDALAPLNSPSVLRVCRRLHDEGWSVLLEGGVLGLSLFSDCDEPELDRLMEWFEEKRAAWLVRRIRVLRVVGGWPRASWISMNDERGLMGLRRVVIRMGVVDKLKLTAQDDDAVAKISEALTTGETSSVRSLAVAARPKPTLRRLPYCRPLQSEMAGWPFSVEQGKQLVIEYGGRHLLMVSSRLLLRWWWYGQVWEPSLVSLNAY
jgi:hypothetical protein